MATQVESQQLRQIWQERISQWEQTGQTQKAFCDAHNFDYHQFGYWRRRLQILEHSTEAKPFRTGFAQVMARPMAASSGLSVTLPNGVRLEGVDAGNVSTVCHLIDRLL
jgi:hypothetical protein